MKKVLPILLLFLVTVFLSGCISIPLGDGEKLTIGFDGINIEEDTEKGNVDNASNEVAENEDIDSSNNVQGNEVEQVVAEPDHSAENNNSEENIIDCQEDIDTLIERVPPNFPIPDCITDLVTTGAEESTSMYYTGSYNTTGDWKDLFNIYKEYLTTNYKISRDSESDSSGEVEYKSEEFVIYISVHQYEENAVHISFRHIDYFD